MHCDLRSSAEGFGADRNFCRYRNERTRAFPSIHCDLRSSGEGVADRRRMRCAHAFGMGVCAITTSADIAPSAPGWGCDSLYPSPVIARKRVVFALRAEFLFLSFPKEKETKKKGNLRACALKNPLIVQSCYAQSKMSCLSSPQLQIALRRPSGGKNCTKREEKVGATTSRPRLRRVLP